VLEILNLSKRYAHAGGPVDALVDVSLSAGAGEFVSVQGPSGCGKSTLLLAAGGLLAGDAGRVLIDGQNPYALAPDARAALRARRVGFVFQQFHLVPYLSVLENVLSPSLALAAKKGTGYFFASPGEQGAGQTEKNEKSSLSPFSAVERARMLIEHFGLAGRIAHKPSELSTGERQRTALARALLNEPGLILADEPTGNLDADSARAVLEYLAEFARQGGSVLLVTHDERAAGYARRTVRMRSGRIVTASSPATTASAPPKTPA
jgi:ABC-type lipoprotein export system ATPase subunit